MRAYCKDCIHFQYCMERTRDIPCRSYKGRERDGRAKSYPSRTREQDRRTGAGKEKTKKGRQNGNSARDQRRRERDPVDCGLHTSGGAGIRR